MLQGKWESFDKNTHNRHLSITIFQCLSHSLYLSDIQLFVKIEVRNSVALGHRFLHSLLKARHHYCSRMVCMLCWRGRGIRLNLRLRWGLMMGLKLRLYLWLFLWWFSLIDNVVDIGLENSSVLSCSFYTWDINAMLFDKTSDKRSSRNTYISSSCWRDWACRFWLSFHLRSFRYAAMCWRRRMFPCPFLLDLQKEISDLADILLLIIYLSDNSWIRRSQLGKLLIRRHISQFLKFLNMITFLNIQFLDRPFFDLFPQIRKMEFNGPHHEHTL